MSKRTTQFDFPPEVFPPKLVALWDDFHIWENPGKTEWIIACRKCNARWALACKKSPAHVGNILHLMNHAASH